ncbi:hypothetical protein FNF29_05231 [Cafeteria roenbergensis]|uniref:Uncharacterized protein n=1 Tax=Cafeteria roenbergensis TaxID=33653 RepID=A0A5A8CC35_CAFRO|nr:hypothetical protein FNF29_05231 [Cafeteria roenbergensis]|eukprot:KAA0150428.1 hypothetical protein FNF29_05231 [Cafeteria roenbergensis]
MMQAAAPRAPSTRTRPRARQNATQVGPGARTGTNGQLFGVQPSGAAPKQSAMALDGPTAESVRQLLHAARFASAVLVTHAEQTTASGRTAGAAASGLARASVS